MLLASAFQVSINIKFYIFQFLEGKCFLFMNREKYWNPFEICDRMRIFGIHFVKNRLLNLDTFTKVFDGKKSPTMFLFLELPFSFFFLEYSLSTLMHLMYSWAQDQLSCRCYLIIKALTPTSQQNNTVKKNKNIFLNSTLKNRVLTC